MVAACGARTIILERSGRQARISGSRLPTVDGSTPLEVNPFNTPPRLVSPYITY
jgi:hypothetical protein